MSYMYRDIVKTIPLLKKKTLDIEIDLSSDSDITVPIIIDLSDEFYDSISKNIGNNTYMYLSNMSDKTEMISRAYPRHYRYQRWPLSKRNRFYIDFYKYNYDRYKEYDNILNDCLLGYRIEIINLEDKEDMYLGTIFAHVRMIDF